MRALLASCELGATGDRDALLAELARLVPAPTRTAIVLNARDDEPESDRPLALTRERSSLGLLGAEASELDLRGFAARPSSALAAVLENLDLVWVSGGSLTALNAAIAATRFASLVIERVQTDALTYGGHSAGAAVAGPPLYGEQLAQRAPRDARPAWGGLGIIGFSIVPHHPPAGAPDTDLSRVSRHITDAGHRCVTLCDGEAIVIDATGERRV